MRGQPIRIVDSAACFELTSKESRQTDIFQGMSPCPRRVSSDMAAACPGPVSQ